MDENMSLGVTRRVDKLQARLRARTRRDGKPLPGYEQSVAAIRAELEQLSLAPVNGENEDA
jgi:hypothetical protein